MFIQNKGEYLQSRIHPELIRSHSGLQIRRAELTLLWGVGALTPQATLFILLLLQIRKLKVSQVKQYA